MDFWRGDVQTYFVMLVQVDENQEWNILLTNSSNVVIYFLCPEFKMPC